MNYKKILPIIVLSAMVFSSCDDQIMEWSKDPSHGEITNDELPLGLAEKISRYDSLKAYSTFTLGVGIGLDLYMTDDIYKTRTDANFDEVTVGYAMKHGPMVNSTGACKFDNVDAFVVKTKEAGLTVFGHTLVWHSNQNATYLNSLIAATIIPGVNGTNVLDLSGLKDGTLTGWGTANSGDGISVVDGKGLSDTSKGIKLIASASSADPWNLQLTSPENTIDSTHTYELSFFIKSDQAGQGRVSFSGLDNNYPSKDWLNTGTASATFATTSQWKQVKVKIDDFADVLFKFNIDLGYLSSVTYYIDVDNIVLVDLDEESTIENWVSNGTFDSNIEGWSKYNGATDANTWVGSTDAYEGEGALKVVTAAANSGNPWSTQIHTDFTKVLESEVNYVVSFMIRSEDVGSIRCSTTGNEQYQGDQKTSPTWSKISWTIVGSGAESGINLDLGKIEGVYYVDNFLVTIEGAGEGSEPTVIEKSDAEKKALITASMEDWISQMVGHYKNDISAWDVVNEPMLESGEVRDGNVSDLADDEFYWVKYMGKDYAVTAFNLARQYGNANDIHFINDYNLESNLTKCQGLVDYVKYIEDKGATVDGIGTQMHISISSDTAKIAQMFELLASTGKLIKISELDIRLGTASPTPTQLEDQANMYRYVVDMYMKYTPENQRYGVTIWSISDSEKEHEYWLPDESPCLWDANYERKHAYIGFANGLAGKDVSEDFTGDLEY